MTLVFLLVQAALPGQSVNSEPDSVMVAGQGSFFASDPEALYTAAVSAYERENFEESLRLFRELIAAGHEAADIYYNMGNAAFRSHSIGYSILYYEKALKLDPRHRDAAHNLDYVSRYKEDVFEEVPEFFLRAWTGAMVDVLSERSWSLLALISFVLFLSMVLVYLFSRGLVWKKTGFFSALIALIIFSVTGLSALSGHRQIAQPTEGIIVAPSVVVRSTPNESGTELFILHEGTPVHVNESLTDWQNIRIIDGREGWIRASEFEHI
jgi:hypothetical protein